MSASSGGQVAAGYAASSAASSVDGEEGASTSDQAVRPPRRRGGRRGDPFNHVYSGPDTSCTVQSAPLPCPLAFSCRAGKLSAVIMPQSCWCIHTSIRALCGHSAFPLRLKLCMGRPGPFHGVCVQAPGVQLSRSQRLEFSGLSEDGLRAPQRPHLADS